jgi:N-acetylneuraminic acid mutarotase
MFGGYGSNWDALDDMWEYDLNSNTWVELDIACPSARDYAMMSYSHAAKKIVMHGGLALISGEEVPLGDTWTYDHKTRTWEELSPPLSPGPRSWHSVVYSARGKKVVLFAGGLTREDSFNDVWMMGPDLVTWTEVHIPPGCPSNAD